MDTILEKIFKIKSQAWRQFIIYDFVAIIPTVIDFSLLYILTEKIKIYYIFSFIIAFSVGLIISYILHKKLTFKDNSQKYFLQFLFFYFSGILGLIVNLSIVFLLVEFFDLWYIFGKSISILVVLLWNFFIHKNITFNKF